jgi:hypothetical protein
MTDFEASVEQGRKIKEQKNKRNKAKRRRRIAQGVQKNRPSKKERDALKSMEAYNV